MSNDRFLLRAWDKELQSMFDDFTITAHNGQIYCGGLNVTQYFIIMQSTSFNDKNGKLIFESDIVKFDGWHGKTGFIKWDKDQANFDLINPRCKDDDIGVSRYLAEDYEIIGNIYENKDLLEESQS